MVISTFQKLLSKTKYIKTEYMPNIDDVSDVLKEIGYSINNTGHGLEAFKPVGNDRYHLEIVMPNDEKIYPRTEITLHKDKDSKVRLFHGAERGDTDVSSEFNLFHRTLIDKLKKRYN